MNNEEIDATTVTFSVTEMVAIDVANYVAGNVHRSMTVERRQRDEELEFALRGHHGGQIAMPAEWASYVEGALRVLVSRRADLDFDVVSPSARLTYTADAIARKVVK